MEDLIAFLRARLDEDEAVIRPNLGGRGLGDDGTFPDYRTYTDDDTNAADDFLFHFRSPRMLREVEAKRSLIDWHAAGGMRNVLTHLASVYADHPDYRAEWRP